MVNDNNEHEHTWECSIIPGIFNCLSCNDVKIYNYIHKGYRIYPMEEVK